MRTRTALTLRVLVLVVAVALSAACGDDDDGDDQSAGTSDDVTTTAAEDTTTTAGDSGGGGGGTSTITCPSDAEISEIVGVQLTSGPPAGTDCFYEDEDFSASVTIIRFPSASAAQLQSEIEDSAGGADAVQSIDVGDGGYAYGASGYAQGFATAGDSTYLADVQLSESGAELDALMQVLELVLAENS